MDQNDFFSQDQAVLNDQKIQSQAPLAERMRPTNIEEVIGQEHLLAQGKLLRRVLKADRLVSAIFYGPPGTGKTTMARIISKACEAHYRSINAVASNVAEMRKIIERARRWEANKRTVLFVDEIHRFNKAQQDILMPDVETGCIILVGATTQNPAFAINGPLLSRSLVFEVKPLEDTHIRVLLERAIKDKTKGFGAMSVEIEPAAIDHFVKYAEGDARKVLNALEVAVVTTEKDAEGKTIITLSDAEESCQMKVIRYDRDEDEHYDTISALIKSIRGSDPDASLYWLAKMITAGEDLRFIMRRLVILASEDIGNAQPQALTLATSALQAVEFVGLPEAQIILGHVVTYLAAAPKSNAAYKAISAAMKDVQENRVQAVPEALRDTHYTSATKLGRGKGYAYPHDFAGGFVRQDYMPVKKKYYYPTDHGAEKYILEKFKKLHENPPSTPPK